MAIVGAERVIPGWPQQFKVCIEAVEDRPRRFVSEERCFTIRRNGYAGPSPQYSRYPTEAGLSQRELAARMGTTQSVISRLEEGGGARNRLDTHARVATALDRHLVLSFPERVPTEMNDALQVA